MEMAMAMKASDREVVEGTYRGEKRHGTWTLRYPDGQKWQEGQYVEGTRHGLWTIWHENGRMSSAGCYQRGRRHGVWVLWQADGGKLGQCEYHDGEVLGMSMDIGSLPA